MGLLNQHSEAGLMSSKRLFPISQSQYLYENNYQIPSFLGKNQGESNSTSPIE